MGVLKYRKVTIILHVLYSVPVCTAVSVTQTVSETSGGWLPDTRSWPPGTRSWPPPDFWLLLFRLPWAFVSSLWLSLWLLLPELFLLLCTKYQFVFIRRSENDQRSNKSSVPVRRKVLPSRYFFRRNKTKPRAIQILL
jgi:hypothetical protein